MTEKEWYLEFHCKDCEMGGIRVEKILINPNIPDELQELVYWLRIHNANGGTFQNAWRRKDDALFGQMLEDGWTLKRDNNGTDEWLCKGVIQINRDLLEVRRTS